MKLTSNLKGQIAATKAELRALELGYIPNKPIFDARYDLILDDSIKLLKVQIKYANGVSSQSKGAVVVKLDYEDRQKNFYVYKNEEVDALVVYIPKIDKLCFFPQSVFVGKRRLNIRLEDAISGRKVGIIFAKDYFW